MTAKIVGVVLIVLGLLILFGSFTVAAVDRDDNYPDPRAGKLGVGAVVGTLLLCTGFLLCPIGEIYQNARLVAKELEKARLHREGKVKAGEADKPAPPADPPRRAKRYVLDDPKGRHKGK